MENQKRQGTIQRQLDDYSQVVPEWTAIGSPANLAATQHYQELLGRGLPENETTKLLALERTFGPANRLRAARASHARTSSQRDTAQEVGRRGSPPSSRRKADPVSILSSAEKRLYQKYINDRVYKDWNAVRAEIKGAATQTSNPQLRAKHARLLR